VARIPDELLDRLKDEVSLVSLVAAHGVELRKTGKDLVGSCPFHDDASPSLVVTPPKGSRWACTRPRASGARWSRRWASRPRRSGTPRRD
jgi:hypothetical protein